MRKDSFIFSIRAKMTLISLVAGALLLLVSFAMIGNTLEDLEQDLIGDMLRGDVNHIKHIIGDGEWEQRDGALFLGDTLIGDCTIETAYFYPFLQGEKETGTFSYTFVKVPDEGLTWAGDSETGYQQGHFRRVAGSTKGPNGENIVGTYMDKKVADVLDEKDVYLGPANVNGRQIYCVYETLKSIDGTVVGAIVVGRSIEEMNEKILTATKRYVVFFSIVIISSLACIALVFNPIGVATSRIEEYLKIVSDGSFPDTPLVINTRDELAAVAYSINEMVVSLKEKELLTSYRKNVQKSAIYSFCVDIYEDRILEGREQFAPIADSEGEVSYSNLLMFLDNETISPDHKAMVHSHLNPDSLETKAETEPEFEITYKVSVKRLLKSTKLNPENELTLLAAGKEWIWQTARVVLVRDSSEKLLAYFDILDVDQKMVDAERIQIMATTDSLTGLYNRRAFEEALKSALAERDARGTLFMIDLDHFKEVNDNLGHPEGDVLLKETAATIKRIFRENDIVCRLGGDEFCAFAFGFMDESLLNKRAEELLEKGHRTYKLDDGKEIKISFSVGVASFPRDAQDMESLYNCADKALYEAKEDGRDCYKFFGQHI